MSQGNQRTGLPIISDSCLATMIAQNSRYSRNSLSGEFRVPNYRFFCLIPQILVSRKFPLIYQSIPSNTTPPPGQPWGIIPKFISRGQAFDWGNAFDLNINYDKPTIRKIQSYRFHVYYKKR